MTNRRMVRRALVSSIISLVLCFAMLLSTTYAWFTDSVTSASNIITSGKLDIGLYYADGTKPVPDATSSDWLDASDCAIYKSDKLWEPGYTDAKHLRIANEGTLSLKYKLAIVPNGEVSKLADVIDVYYIDEATQVAARDSISSDKYIGTLSTLINNGIRMGVLDAGEDHTVTLVMRMQYEVSNEYQGLSIGTDFSIQLVATQSSAESDGFGNDYDDGAVLPQIGTAVKEEYKGVSVKADNVTAVIPAIAPAGNYAFRVANKLISVDNAGKTVLSMDITLTKDGVSVSADGIVYTVRIEMEKNLEISGVKHNGIAIEDFLYDPASGILTIKTESFSPFSVIYEEADADTLFLPAEPEVAAKLQKADVIAVDEKGNEYASLEAAVKGGSARIYVKEGADLGAITHLDIANDLVIYGNGAFISGGERDFSIDTYIPLTKDITVSIFNLHGVALWGQRNTEYKVSLNLYNCNNISRVYINGTSGVNNIGIYNCTASTGNAEAYKNLIGDTAVYSNANGSITVDGCTFTGIGCPVNLNHKIAGEQTVTVTDTKFVDCSTEGNAAYYAPIRLYNSTEGANQTLTAVGNIFTYSEGKAPVNKADVLINAKHNDVDAKGAVKALVQIGADVALGEQVDLAFAIYTAEDLFRFASEINSVTPYTASVYDAATVLLMNDIDLEGAEWIPIGDDRSQRTEFRGVFDGQGYTVSNFKITKKTDRDDENKSSYGFFGNVKGTVKNLTVTDVTVENVPKYAAILIGRLNGGLVENCHVKNSSVIIENWTVGALVGQFNNGMISGCTVRDTTVKGYAAVGAIAGIALGSGERTIENCTVTGSTLAMNGSFGGAYDKMLGAIVGSLYSGDLTVKLSGCTAACNNVNTLCGYISDGDKLIVDGKDTVVALTADELASAIRAGKYVMLGSDVEMTSCNAISNADFTLDGNGYTINMSDSCVNTYALFDITGGKATLRNVTFDGVKEGAVIRTVGVDLTVDGVTVKNADHTQQQGLFRLLGKSTVRNCTFENNVCSMVITLNYDADENEYPQVIENCVFKNNTCSSVAVVYYVCGTGATVSGNIFTDNKVSSTGNAATLYMGFTENHKITDNVFENNSVSTTSETSKRVAGALMIGYKAIITGNSFVNNKATGVNAKANDVCASVHYTDIDLSGNYWGGNAPVENDDYFVEYPDRNRVIINGYLTSFEK